jgi:hypothetical protein
MARDKTSGDMMDTPGFKTPMPVGSDAGDAFDAPPAKAPGGPIPDPIGNLPSRGRRGPSELPTR